MSGGPWRSPKGEPKYKVQLSLTLEQKDALEHALRIVATRLHAQGEHAVAREAMLYAAERCKGSRAPQIAPSRLQD